MDSVELKQETNIDVICGGLWAYPHEILLEALRVYFRVYAFVR